MAVPIPQNSGASYHQVKHKAPEARTLARQHKLPRQEVDALGELRVAQAVSPIRRRLGYDVCQKYFYTADCCQTQLSDSFARCAADRDKTAWLASSIAERKGYDEGRARVTSDWLPYDYPLDVARNVFEVARRVCPDSAEMDAWGLPHRGSL